MSPAPITQPQTQQQDPDAFVRLGEWLFKHRTSLPLPLALLLLLVPPSEQPSPLLTWVGAALVAAGELLRLAAVRQIGTISRTRSDRLGPLIATGPFARVRNPLYLGNIAIWAGFAVSAALLRLVPMIVLLLYIEYHAIVCWEERLLESRLGETYRAYAARVPRWVPRLSSSLKAQGLKELSSSKFSWRETLFSERGTLIAIALGYLLLWIKSRTI
jgi:protein-S-isoprenylcysteine O-methyltransferase Ste14